MVECEFICLSSSKGYKCVLIDTWWNVNNRPLTELRLQSGFNRYMVECEFSLRTLNAAFITVLIDTWWNVNHVAINV